MLTQQQLESHLWSCANVLRGSIDSQDFKGYILTLMFFKRLADQWRFEADEAVEKLVADGAKLTDELPDRKSVV